MEIWQTVIAGMFLLASTYWAKSAHTQAKQANEAVNNNKDSSKPRIYDLVLVNNARTMEVMRWKDSFRGTHLENGDSAKQHAECMERGISGLDKRMKDLEDAIEQRGDTT